MASENHLDQPPKHTYKDCFPLTLDGLRKLPNSIWIEPQKDREKSITQLTEFYLRGLEEYKKEKQIFDDLPDNRLWPDSYFEAYSWFQTASYELQGSPGLIFHELISNADIHGRGFSGGSAAWDASTFILRIADKGSGIGSSHIHSGGIGHTLISDFFTEQIRSTVQKEGHILGLCRDLDQVVLPDQTDMLGKNISKKVAHIRKLRMQGRKLPQLNPNSSTYSSFDKNKGPFGAMVTHNRLGQIISVKVFKEEPNGWL